MKILPHLCQNVYKGFVIPSLLFEVFLYKENFTFTAFTIYGTLDIILFSEKGGVSLQIDLKQKILLAFYVEYQKDSSQLMNIDHRVVGVTADMFVSALEKLDNEELVIYELTYPSTDPKVVSYVAITRRGIEYIEQKFGIDSVLSGSEKVAKVAKSLNNSSETTGLIANIVDNFIF
jgi:hypothetical protein